MKFERPKTAKSQKRLKSAFYFSFFLFFFSALLRLINAYVSADFGVIFLLFSYLTIFSFFILFVLYVAHIFVEGLEKPNVIPTETQNKINDANASEASADDAETERLD